MTNKLISAIVLSGLSVVSFAADIHLPRRISGQILDLGKVHTIYMVAGMATLVEIPTAVTGIRLGNPDAVQYYRPEKPENEVTLVLKDNLAKPTNLIIRSNKKKYVFDIVPSKEVHQDTIEVLGSYGGASIDTQGVELIESSDQTIAKPKGGQK